MRVKITAGGIYGADGEIPIGTELTVASEPKGWAGRYEIVSRDDGKKTPVTNPSTGATGAGQSGGEGSQTEAGQTEGGQTGTTTPEGPFEAKDKGEGWWAIFGANDEQVGKSIRKTEGEAFNALSDEDKAAYVAELTKD